MSRGGHLGVVIEVSTLRETGEVVGSSEIDMIGGTVIPPSRREGAWSNFATSADTRGM